MDDLILTRQRDTLFEIILNRPGKRNAINLEMFRAFDAAVTQANRTPGLRAVLIRGEGESFSAGIDVGALLGLAQTFGPHWMQRMRSITDEFQGILTRLERLELPTIALLHGHCLGLAFSWRWPATCGSPPRAPRSACPKHAWGSSPTWAARRG